MEQKDWGGGYGRSHAVIDGDEDLTTLQNALPAVLRVLKTDSWAVVFCAAKRRYETETLLLKAGLYPFGEVIWDKGMPGLGYHIRYAHETAVICRRGNPGRPDKPLLSVIRETGRRSSGHPHEKPVGLMRELVSWACPPGGVVLDPFTGSGSTAVACLSEGLGFFGCEIDEAHHATAVRRVREAGGAGSLFGGAASQLTIFDEVSA